jgi:hypothetical protein
LFEELQYSPIEWPWKTTRLRRDPVQDVRQRMSSARPTAAETYHRNSSLFPARLHELPAAWLDPSEVRSAFGRRQAGLLPPTPHEEAVRFPLAGPILSRTVGADAAQRCYALELRISDDAGLARYEPTLGRREPLREVTPQQEAVLAAALSPFGAATSDASASALLPASPVERLFVIGCFPRNEVLYGARGYRRTLMEAGRFIESIVEESRRQHTTVQVTVDFFDSVVNQFVDADGLEEATLAVLVFSGGTR